MRSIVMFGALSLFGWLSAEPAHAQGNLEVLLLDLLRQGVTLAPPAQGTDHSAHFIADEEGENSQFAAVRRFNQEVGRQVSSFPQATSAGSFSYRLDPELGVLTRPTQSFGSIYSDRPFTVGSGKYNLGVSFSQFSYDGIDGVGLRDGGMHLVFLHEDAASDGRANPFFEGDVITAQLFVGVDVNVATMSATYGVSDRLDMGLVVPVLDVSLDIASVAHVERLSTESTAPDTHVFTNGTSSNTTRRGAEATGVGDVSLLFRWLVDDFEASDFRTAVTGGIRFPTGDEKNFQGTGGTSATGSLLFSQPAGAAALHTVLGLSVGSEDLPLQIHWGAGVDWAVDPKLTLAFDLLGLRVADQAEVLVSDQTYQYNQASDGSVSLADASLSTLSVEGEGEARNEVNASIGFKINVGSTVLLTGNGLVPLNDSGLRDDFATLFGVDYTF